MLINEVCKKTKLTKKAVEYYVLQGLLSPEVSENGYRNFRKEDVERLSKISVFRKLGLGIEDIKAVLSDSSNAVLQKLSVKKELLGRKALKKAAILEEFSCGRDYQEISRELDALEQNATIAERLLNSFPGYYGKFICLHFASFLDAPVLSEDQKEAYQKIINFLDNVPELQFPEEVQEYLEENTGGITVEQINGIVEMQKKYVKEPEKFLEENKETLEFYYRYMQSEEYKASPAYELRLLLEEFNQSTGYYDTFIPAMKKLSPAYAKYQQLLEIAGEKLFAAYPQQEENIQLKINFNKEIL